MSLTMTQANEIAKAYWTKYQLGGTLDMEKNRFVAGFYQVEGPVWIVYVDYPPSTFDCMDEVTILVSIKAEAVNHIINRFGYDKYPHEE